MTTLQDFGGVLGWPLDTFLLGSHNFMVTTLGLKKPLSIIIIQKKGMPWMEERGEVVESPVTYDFTLHLRARDHTT